MTLLKKILALCLFLSVFVACRKSTNANWDVDVVLPVAHSVLDIKNFAGDGLVDTDNNGLLHFRLNREIAAIKLDSLITLPDTTVSTSFTAPVIIPYVLSPGQSIPNLTIADFKFNIADGIALKTIEIRTGTLNVKFSNHIQGDLELTYVIQTAKKNGVPLTIKEIIPYGVNALEKSYDISGYHFDLRGNSGKDYNTVSQTCTLTLHAGSSTVVIPAGTNTLANIQVGYSQIIPQLVEGYFGKQTVDIEPDTVNINLSGSLKAKNFKLNEAIVDFDVVNEFGAEFNASIYQVSALAKSGQKVNLTEKLANLNINRATKVGQTIYPSVKGISFTHLNSNITDFLSALPDQLAYQGKINLNPLGNISGYNDFAFYNTGLRIVAHIDIPLKFNADEFELKTKTEVNFSGVTQLDKVNSGNFGISVTNGFPFAARLQGFMYDSAGVLLDSLFLSGSNIIDRGQLNTQNEVITPNKSKVFVPINRAKVEHLRKTKRIEFVSDFLLPPNPPDIKILEHYQMEISVIAELNYNVNLR